VEQIVLQSFLVNLVMASDVNQKGRVCTNKFENDPAIVIDAESPTTP